MINKTSLRIGNKVLLGNDIVTLKEIGEFEASFNERDFLFPYAAIEPVNLSPKLLEACGFEKDRNGWHSPETHLSLTEQLYPCWLDRMLWPQGLPEFKNLSLKHLHQLQNLFYWVTGGSELSINLEKVKA